MQHETPKWWPIFAQTDDGRIHSRHLRAHITTLLPHNFFSARYFTNCVLPHAMAVDKSLVCSGNEVILRTGLKMFLGRKMHLLNLAFLRTSAKGDRLSSPQAQADHDGWQCMSISDLRITVACFTETFAFQIIPPNRLLPQTHCPRSPPVTGTSQAN